jgi:hypothetical protein
VSDEEKKLKDEREVWFSHMLSLWRLRERTCFILFVFIPYVLLFECLFGLITPDLGPFGVLPATHWRQGIVQILLDMAG